MNVLLVDDERGIRVTLGDALTEAGHAVRRAANLAEARTALASAPPPDCVIADLRLPDGLGLDLLEEARRSNPDVALLVITAHQTIETAIAATKQGADYLIKPFLNAEVIARLEKVEEVRRLRAEVRRLRTETTGRFQLDRLVGRSPRMRELFRLIETVGSTDATVLIRGESGTGKELVAHALHRHSPRAEKPLIAVSCAALPENLLEDELFGHEKGAYTGAHERKHGCFDRADGGTIFLDDIDDMSFATQVKLLRVLQERAFCPIGGTRTIKINVRVVAAVKTDLSLLVRRGLFRDDLYFRLRVVELQLPPLRERPEDIPFLVEHFIKLHGGGRKYVVASETMAKLVRYRWPGNVRELENSVLRAVALAGNAEELEESLLLQPPAAMKPEAGKARPAGGPPQTVFSSPNEPPAPTTTRSPTAAAHSPEAVVAAAEEEKPGNIAPGGNPPAAAEQAETFLTLRQVVREAELAHLRRALELTGGNKAKAAELLGISRKSLWEKLKDAPPPTPPTPPTPPAVT